MSSIRPDAEKNHPGIEELSAELWDRFFAINVRAPMLLAQDALPHMRKAGWGRIVNNTTSFRTMLRVLPYGATKSALESMSAVWADELKSAGITVNVLIPGGPTDTPFVADEAGWPREQMLKPAIMGPPAVWLMSNASDGFTGQRVTAADWDTSRRPTKPRAARHAPSAGPTWRTRRRGGRAASSLRKNQPSFFKSFTTAFCSSGVSGARVAVVISAATLTASSVTARPRSVRATARRRRSLRSGMAVTSRARAGGRPRP